MHSIMQSFGCVELTTPPHHPRRRISPRGSVSVGDQLALVARYTLRDMGHFVIETSNPVTTSFAVVVLVVAVVVVVVMQ